MPDNGWFQVDGGPCVATLKEAMEQATYKVSFSLPSGERVRLVLKEARWGEVQSDMWVYEPIEDEIKKELQEQGLPESVVRLFGEQGARKVMAARRRDWRCPYTSCTFEGTEDEVDDHRIHTHRDEPQAGSNIRV